MANQNSALSSTNPFHNIISIITMMALLFALVPSAFAAVASVPATVTGVSVTPENSTATVTWVVNADQDLLGYNVYVDGSKVNDEIVTEVSYEVIGLTNGQQYYFQVTAMNNSGESLLDGGDFAIPRNLTPPAQPSGVTAVPELGYATISWDTNEEMDILDYYIYLDDNGSIGGVLPANTTSHNVNLTNGTTYNITVVARNTSGVFSEASEPVSVTPGARNAKLGTLVMNGASYSPTFHPDTLTYSAAVANNVTHVSITPTVADHLATVTVNGQLVTQTYIPGMPGMPPMMGFPGSPGTPAMLYGGTSNNINLVVGENKIEVEVTAQNKETKNNYVIVVTRAGASNADLSLITTSEGMVDPAFTSAQLDYDMDVAYETDSIKLTPTLSDSHAVVRVGNDIVSNGVESLPIDLAVGANSIEVTVTAEDATTTKTYTVTVTRAAASSNADLSGLALSDGQVLNAPFNAGTLNYTASVANGLTNLTVTPTVAEGTATLTVNGAVASQAVDLNVGSNVITIVVTAQDAATTKTYTITVTRAASSNADLSGLILSDGQALNAPFNAGKLDYIASVANGITKLTVTPTVAEGTATVTVNGMTASQAVDLNVGSTVITVVVTAQDAATTKTYTITVIRAATTPSTPTTNTPVTSTDGKLTLPLGQTGEVSLKNEVAVSIPAGAANKELKLTIEKLQDTKALLKDKDVVSPMYEILKNFPEDFNKSVTLTFFFDLTLMNNGKKAVVFYYDEVKKSWVEIPGGKVNGNKISVAVNHFTKFAVMAVSEEAEVPVVEPVTVPTTDVIFSDISGHWAEANIKLAVSNGMVRGYVDGTFKAGNKVTRAEFVVMLTNVLKLQGEGAELTFTDNLKIGSWAQKAVAQAVQADIIKGNEDGSFRPNAVMTRSEMAVMLANALGQSAEVDATTGFADEKDIPAWAKSSIAYVKQAGLIQGKGNNQFAPQDHATRAEAVTVLMNIWSQKNK